MNKSKEIIFLLMISFAAINVVHASADDDEVEIPQINGAAALILPERLDAIQIAAQNESVKARLVARSGDISLYMRSVFLHDFFGVVAGTTTSALPKILAGISSICISEVMANTKTITQSSSPIFLSQNSSVADLLNIGSTLDFSQMRLLSDFNITTNTTTHRYEAFPYKSGVSLLYQKTALLGYGVGGLSILSGVFDLLTAGYNIFSCTYHWSETFSSMVEESVRNRDTQIADVDLFLDHAVGEYIDMYQKRGMFNRKRFITMLKRY